MKYFNKIINYIKNMSNKSHLIIALFFVSIAYASISTNLVTSGIARIRGIVYDLSLEGTNVSLSKTSTKIAYTGEIIVDVTPKTGYYLKSAECTNGYTTNIQLGVDKYSSQSVIISNNNNKIGSTCKFTAERITASLLSYSNAENTKCTDTQCSIDELNDMLTNNRTRVLINKILASINPNYSKVEFSNLDKITEGTSFDIGGIEYKVFYSADNVIKLIAMDTIASTSYGSNQYYGSSLVQNIIEDYANKIGLKYHVRIPTSAEVSSLSSDLKVIGKSYYLSDVYTSADNYVYYTDTSGKVTHVSVSSVLGVRPVIVLFNTNGMTLEDITDDTPLGTYVSVGESEYVLFERENGVAKLMSMSSIGSSTFGSDYFYEGNSIESLVNAYASNIGYNGKLRLPTLEELSKLNASDKLIGTQYYTSNYYSNADGYVYFVHSNGNSTHIPTGKRLNVRVVLTYVYDGLDNLSEIKESTPVGTAVDVNGIDYVIFEKNNGFVKLIALTCIDFSTFGSEHFYEGNSIYQIIQSYSASIGLNNKVRIPSKSEISGLSSFISSIGRNYWSSSIYTCDGCGTSYAYGIVANGTSTYFAVGTILGVRPVITYSYSYVNGLANITTNTPVGKIVKVGNDDYVIYEKGENLFKLVSLTNINSSIFGSDDYYEGNDSEKRLVPYSELQKLKRKIHIPSSYDVALFGLSYKDNKENYWITTKYSSAGYLYASIVDKGSTHIPISTELGLRPIITYSCNNNIKLSDINENTPIGTTFNINGIDYALYKKDNGVAKLAAMSIVDSSSFGSDDYFEANVSESLLYSYAEIINEKDMLSIPSNTDVNNMPNMIKSIGNNYWTTSNYTSAANYVYATLSNGSVTHVPISNVLGIRPILTYVYGEVKSYTSVSSSTNIGDLIDIKGRTYVVFDNSDSTVKMISLSTIGNSIFGSNAEYVGSTIESRINAYANQIEMPGKVRIPTKSEVASLDTYLKSVGRDYWTSTKYTSAAGYVYYTNTDGSYTHIPVGTVLGIRPVITLTY